MIVGLCMARNEADYIGQVIDHLYANGVDKIVVEDGTSTDQTVEVAREHGAEVVRETHRAYDQPERMNALCADWCSPGDWVIPFDADEFWYATEGGTIRQALEDTLASKCWARMYQHKDWDHRERDPKPLPKVAFQWWPEARLAFGNHSVTVRGDDAWGVLDLREWQYRSFAHFVAKVEKQRDLVGHTPGLGMYGTHKNAWLSMSMDELGAEWVRMQQGDWLFDPIPSLSSPPSTAPTS